MFGESKDNNLSFLKNSLSLSDKILFLSWFMLAVFFTSAYFSTFDWNRIGCHVIGLPLSCPCPYIKKNVYIWPHQLEKKVRNKWYWIFFIWRKYIEYLHSTHQLQWPNLVKNIISCNIWDLRNGSILCLAVVPTLRWPVIRHPPFLLQ